MTSLASIGARNRELQIDVLLGIDLGTSSVKVAVMGEDGFVKEMASAGYSMDTPRPGWAEIEPSAWWLATRNAVTSLDAAHRRAVEAIGLSGQMHGVVLCHEDGHAMRAAILWADGRSVQEVDRYRQLDPRLLHQLANPPAQGMAGPTLLWLKTHESNLYMSARWSLQPKDWLRFQMTTEARSEPTDASATLLYDFGRDTWSHDVLKELDILPSLLPDLVPSDEPAGRLNANAARELGLEPGLPVAAGAADAAASLVGHGILEPGPVLLTIGTGAQVSSVRNELRRDSAVGADVYRTIQKGKWYSMAAILNAGLALDWVRRLFDIDWTTLYRSASAPPPGAGGVSFRPHLVGERAPRFDADARACWTGIGFEHGRDHLLKAALEGVAFSVRGAVEAMEAAGIAVTELHLAGGGTMDESWRQLLADVLGKSLLAATSPAGAARGAAVIAGLASGVYKTGADSVTALGTEMVAQPGGRAGDYEDLYGRYKSLLPQPSVKT